MVDSIFRLTNAVDTEATVGPTEKIIFNTGTTPDSTGRQVSTSFEMITDLNPHPNPRRKLNFIQDSLLGVVEVTIVGYFIQHKTTLGPRNLFNWEVDDKQNSNFQNGRFGLTVDSFSNGLLNVVPTIGKNGTGYMLSSIFVEDVEDPRDKVSFIAKFLRNGTITTVT